MTYDFENQNGIGKQGELIVKSWLLQQHNISSLLDVSSNKKYQKDDIDIIVNFTDGNTVTYEVKTDSFLTGNLFFETVSNTERNTPGCMLYTKADYILYFFIRNNNLYKLPTIAFREWVISNKDKFKEKSVNNKYYHSKGLLVPLSMIENKFGKPLHIH